MMRIAFLKQPPAPESGPAPGAAEPAATQAIDAGIIREIAKEAAVVGRAAADLNGVVHDVSAQSSHYGESFKTLDGQLRTMLLANRAITGAADASRDHVRSARDAVEKVGEGVIGVVDTLRRVADAASDITQIAIQTRLVAFNASVEARRAGEAGRGFGVVAEAVKDLAVKVEESSKLIRSTVAQLDDRIDLLAREIRDTDEAGSDASFHSALRRSETSVSEIVAGAQQNVAHCDTILATMQGLSAHVEHSARALTQARERADTFLRVSETLMELTAIDGVVTEDTPFIDAVCKGAAEVARLFEEAIRRGDGVGPQATTCVREALTGPAPADR